MNRICITGNLTKDIELRHTQSGVAVINFNIGVRRDYKNENGEYSSDFPSCIAYKHNAEYFGKYAKKGDKLEIEGRLQTRSYEDKEGKKRYITEVVVEKGSILTARQKPENKENDPYKEFADEHPELDK